MASSDDSYDSESEDEIEPDRNIDEEAKNIQDNLLPAKSGKRYKLCYNKFTEWARKNQITDFTENVFLVYFNEQSRRLKPSTLWGEWSMLRSVMTLCHNINLKTFDKLKAFMKKQSRGFRAKKSKTFLWNQINTFLQVAPDQMFLAMKVILIFGVCGALRTIEFCNIHTSDIEDTGTKYIVSIPETKTYIPRSFVIGPPLYNVVQKYAALRPYNMPTDRFFVNYQNGTCKRQVIGKNKFASTPKSIATALKLPEPERFTGHSFRRTSATLVANAEPNITILMQHSGWASESVARGYCDSSLQTKDRIFQHIVSENKQSHVGPSTSFHTENSPSNIPPARNNSNANVSPSSNANSRSASTHDVDSSFHNPSWGNDSDDELLENFDSVFLEMPNSRTPSPSAEIPDPSTSRSTAPLASMENVRRSSPSSAHLNPKNSSRIFKETSCITRQFIY